MFLSQLNGCEVEAFVTVVVIELPAARHARSRLELFDS